MASTTLESYYTASPDSYNINGIIHVGANDAQEFNFYDKFPGPKLYFEPIPHVAQKIKNKIGDKIRRTDRPVTVEVLACGSQNLDEITLHVSSNAGNSSSILDGKNSGHFARFGITTESDIQVKMVRLDTYMESHLRYLESLGASSLPYNTLVIDTEGYDLEVLKGAEITLKSINYLMVESWADNFFIGAPTFDEQNSWILAHGFELVKSDWFGGNNPSFGNQVYRRALVLANTL